MSDLNPVKILFTKVQFQLLDFNKHIMYNKVVFSCLHAGYAQIKAHASKRKTVRNMVMQPRFAVLTQKVSSIISCRFLMYRNGQSLNT